MQTLEFTPEEIEVLREVIHHCTSEMDMEVLRTDTRDFREMLKHRRDILEQILAKIPGTAVPA
jgi:hypothetical protein